MAVGAIRGGGGGWGRQVALGRFFLLAQGWLRVKVIAEETQDDARAAPWETHLRPPRDLGV